MNYRDIIRQMKSTGHYSEADSLKRSIERRHLSDRDRVYSRNDARDGLSFVSYAGDMAERAFDDLKYQERREQARQEEEERRRVEEERELHRRRQAQFEQAARQQEEEEQPQE